MTVRLYAITEDADGATVETLVATAVTDADGYYRFSSTVTNDVEGDGGPDGGNLRTFTAYEIRLDEPGDYAAGGPLEGLQLTLEGQTSGDAEVLDDAVDSDATLSDGDEFGVDRFPVVAVAPLSPGENDHSFDIGLTDGQVRIGDRVWFDVNRDGVQDDGEPGIGGVRVTIVNADGSPVFDLDGVEVTSTVTDADGRYLFDNLPPGEYRVTVEPPAGYIASTATVLTSGELDEGDQDLTLDFGFVPTVSVGDRVWLDVDRDGVQDDGEPGIPGVELALEVRTGTDANGDPVWGPAVDVFGDPVVNVTTDADGSYLFDVLPLGEYRVSVVTPPVGLDPTEANAIAGEAISVDLNVNGASDLTLDFGFYAPSVSVGDRVWFDLDGDGVQDDGEPGIPGVVLALEVWDGTGWVAAVDVFGDLVADVTTDADGSYLFTALPLGEYRVQVVTPPAGLTPTEANAIAGSAASEDLNVNGASDLTLDFGYVAPISQVGGIVRIDTAGDGVHDGGDPPVAGATVTLTLVDGSEVIDVLGRPVGPVVTGADGRFLFEMLPSGQYVVTIVPPAGSEATTPITLTTVVLGPGEDDLTLEYGVTTPSVTADEQPGTGQAGEGGTSGDGPAGGVLPTPGEAGVVPAPGEGDVPLPTLVPAGHGHGVALSGGSSWATLVLVLVLGVAFGVALVHGQQRSSHGTRRRRTSLGAC